MLLILVGMLRGVVFYLEYRGSTFLRNVGEKCSGVYGIIFKRFAVIVVGKTALSESWPLLDDSSRKHLIFSSLDFKTIISLQSKVVSLASNPQPGVPGPCIYALLIDRVTASVV
jgi:hypothetical protein